jgi:hypothetical protein
MDTWRALSRLHQATIVIMAIATAGMVLLAAAGQTIRPANAVLVFLLLTLLLSATFGLKVSLISTVVSDFCLVFFFFEPIYVLWVHDDQLRLTTAIFLIASLLVGSLLYELRPQLRAQAAGGSVWPSSGIAALAPASPAPATAARSHLEISLGKHSVTVDGREILLTPTEFGLLTYLAENVGKLLTHREILASVWGEEYSKDNQILRAYIKAVRGKLGDDPANPHFIRTETRLGYRFMNPGAEFVD